MIFIFTTVTDRHVHLHDMEMYVVIWIMCKDQWVSKPMCGWCPAILGACLAQVSDYRRLFSDLVVGTLLTTTAQGGEDPEYVLARIQMI